MYSMLRSGAEKKVAQLFLSMKSRLWF